MEKQAEERARIVMEALKQREKRYKLEEEVKILEEQASIEYEKKKKEEERKKKEELKRRDEERKYEEERIKKMQDEERRLKEHAERKKLEEKKIADELAMKKEEEKKLTLQARVPGAIVSQEIISKRSFREPEIDGNPEPSIWQNIQPYLIVTKNKSEREKLIIIKSIYANDYIFFYLQWEDNTENVTHKTWIWNKDKKQYEIGGDHEDKVALMFGLGNSFDACMLRGIIYEADVWEWGAARTNPAGFADDQKIIVSSERIRRANSYRAKNGRNIWIKFIFDQGEPCYREDVVVDYKWDKVPRYSSCFPTESRADIKAKGIWKEGIWQVEFKRKLNTKDKDNDIVFNTRKEYLFGVAIFDHDKQINHYTSDNLILKFVQ
ncbi:MAG: hypothetical protein HY934_07535 [Candidatus Firestonebacteria bacterium]|nr:hypothetical protein [Candidatus Firestonebacteria bacterium]